MYAGWRRRLFPWQNMPLAVVIRKQQAVSIKPFKKKVLRTLCVEGNQSLLHIMSKLRPEWRRVVALYLFIILLTHAGRDVSH